MTIFFNILQKMLILGAIHRGCGMTLLNIEFVPVLEDVCMKGGVGQNVDDWLEGFIMQMSLSATW